VGRTQLVGGRGHDALFAGPGDDLLLLRDHRSELGRCGKGRDLALVDKSDETESCRRLEPND